MCKQREKCLSRLEKDGSETVLLAPTRTTDGRTEKRVGVNDVVVDRAGRIYVTVPGDGSVYGFDPDGSNPRVVISGLKGPNGLMLSPRRNETLRFRIQGAAALRFRRRSRFRGSNEQKVLCGGEFIERLRM